VSYTWTGINNAYLNPGKRKEKQKRKKKIEKKKWIKGRLRASPFAEVPERDMLRFNWEWEGRKRAHEGKRCELSSGPLASSLQKWRTCLGWVVNSVFTFFFLDLVRYPSRLPKSCMLVQQTP
jgi:hypothetical protein